MYGYKCVHIGDNVPMTAERVAWFMFSGGTHMILQNFIITNGQAFKPSRFKAMEQIIWAPETLGMEDITSLLFYKINAEVPVMARKISNYMVRPIQRWQITHPQGHIKKLLAPSGISCFEQKPLRTER